MSLKRVRVESAENELIPAGSHLARIWAIVDLGTHADAAGDSGDAQAHRHLVEIAYELPSCLREDGKPHVVAGRVTLTWSKRSNLPRIFEAAGLPRPKVGTDADLSILLGRGVVVAIQHKVSTETGRANHRLTGAPTQPVAGTTVPSLVRPPLFFDIDDENADPDQLPADLPDVYSAAENKPVPPIELIKASPEWCQRQVRPRAGAPSPPPATPA